MTSESKQTQSLAQAARQLVAANSAGILATLRSDDGYPYSSIVEYLPLDNGDIVMLLSTLAEHQKYLSADPRASLLVAPYLNQTERLAQARVTLLGNVIRVEDKNKWRAAYLQYHPQSETYLDFNDFQFYQLQVKQARYIAGFGRMDWINSAGYACNSCS